MVGHLHCSPHAPCFTPKGYDPLARGVCRPGAELCRETPASARTQNSPALASFRNTGTRAWRMAGPDSLLALHCVLFLPDLRGGSSGAQLLLSHPPPDAAGTHFFLIGVGERYSVEEGLNTSPHHHQVAPLSVQRQI
ncbi:hypothetical protein Pcinc_003087 [Petrolisthes cinctipes]|uniref:Uncharacterized protein n=1 Tax=Petrolisthes cinctipes TaxID=88211 RepID=A0AAE1L1N4_PETCI|nr:hypothetical protein Pcinc_003087 [Petrolisthes cinctipes]